VAVIGYLLSPASRARRQPEIARAIKSTFDPRRVDRPESIAAAVHVVRMRELR
jgi:hypothetical protein